MTKQSSNSTRPRPAHRHCPSAATVLLSCVLTGVVSSVLLGGCRGEQAEDADRLFELVDPSTSNIQFVNELEYAYDFNIYRYRNFYNGGGVALGDVDKDGLLDVFLVGNQVPNRLYLNEGDFVFRDVTSTAGISGRRAWSTGASMVDVNGDGWLDIYVCNSGIVEGDDRKNELYVNQGDGTFVEAAETYGIADGGLSVHGSFLDYDRDGDLDLYLLNNSYRSIGSFDLQDNTRHIRHEAGGDRLYRNDGPLDAPQFVDVSEEAGIYGSEIGFGLGVSAADVNRDGWPDLYISNDFFERDYLYVNRRDGTFAETLIESIESVSATAMGGDIADVNGDGYPDIFVTDMLPGTEHRLKMVASFDTWDRYQSYINDGYYHQFTRNTLQLNRGAAGGAPPENGPGAPPPVYFSEVGRMSGVDAADWGWGALIADFDLDGYRDVFVPNGIYHDLIDADYLVEIRDEATMSTLIGDNHVDFERLIDMIPSRPIPNHVFAGGPDVRFADTADAWGLAQPGFSSGSAYGDLDNDGDLDLVVNNVNMETFVYRSRATELYPDRAWLQIELEGPSGNSGAIGTQVTAWSGSRQWFVEQQPVRGFQSSVDPTLHLGLGREVHRLDSLIVRWPDGRSRTMVDVALQRRERLSYDDAYEEAGADTYRPQAAQPLLEAVDPAALGLAWRHRENTYNDFERQPLLFHMRSTEGPAACLGDADGDGREDLYLGGARDQPGTVFLAEPGGEFGEMPQPALDSDRISEDTDCVWFDADGDGDEDLYVASGGSELPASSSALADRLYLNDGTGRLEHSDQPMISATAGFEPTGTVSAADVDGDGDVDLFVGARMRPFAHGIPADGHLLINDGSGGFEEVTDSQAPGLRELGLITASQWGDLDGDGDEDLIVAGEWMPLTVFENEAGTLRPAAVLEATSGWWNAVALADLDGDGDLDLIGGNHGLNSRFRASLEEPVQMWVDDFDDNGSVEQVVALYREGRPYPLALRHDLVDQLPYLEESYPTYASFAGETVHDVFSEEELGAAVHLRAVELRSVVGWNDGQGRFRIEPLPDEAQLAPMYGIAATDLDGDGDVEILMGGNLYEAKPQVGRYDASFGAVLEVDAAGVRTLPHSGHGFWVTGPVRRIFITGAGPRPLVLAMRNNDSPAAFTYGD